MQRFASTDGVSFVATFEVDSIFADRYQIKKPLGKGGMGMVYLVRDWELKRDLALKTLLPKYAKNSQAVRRFRREVSVAQQLDHPCVVKIFDARKHEDILFYTMEYFDGKTLRDLMRAREGRGQHMGVGSTVRILSLICHALEHAHEITIHRDVTPENVMVLPNGDVKLLDFGLAKLSTMDADLTKVGISLGKIQYTAPEQRADAKNVDLRADIYSLGVMFYEMLSGQFPLGNKKLMELVPDLPAECDALVCKATAEKPEDRHSSAKEFRLELQAVYELIRGVRISGVADAEPVLESGTEKLPVFTAMDDNRPRWQQWLYALRSRLLFWTR
ncbi:MAG TPA: serine/threonine protein kinase [Candidatus Hydrogenedentes bacterium]|nr:serine/threonine protein kinase [Candidatus Hydrogenedentota bacterium]